MTQKCPMCAYPAPDEATNCPSCQASLWEVDVPSAPAGGTTSCPECNREIGESVGKCPICGHRLTPDKLAGAKKVLKIGFLSAIAIIFIGIGLSGTRFGSNKDKAYLAAMKADLHNLLTAEESYFSDNVAYTTTFTSTVWSPWGQATVTIGAADSTGWNARATHVSLPGSKCAVFGGTGPAIAPATNVGEVACTP